LKDEIVDIVKIVADKLGVDESIARKALGLILNLAKSQLGEEQFKTIAQYIPGVEGILADAGAEEGGGGLLGSITGMLGGGKSGVAETASALSGFSEMGLGPDAAAKTVDAVQEHVESQGGDNASAITEALKGLLG